MTTPFLLDEIKAEEGCRLTAYQDTRGVWTIGYGHTGPEVVPGLVWTQDQADAALEADLQSTIQRLSWVAPWFGSLDDVRQDVLADMAFNLGVGGLMKFKDAMALADAGQFTRAAAAMLDSDWAREVPDRAQRLAQMMKTGARS